MSGYSKKIIILSQTERSGGGAREATGIVKLEKLNGTVTGRAALFNIGAEGLYIGIKCKNLPLQSFVISSEPETAFKLHSASEIEDCVCIIARDTSAGFAPVLSGASGRKGFSESLLYSFARNTTQNLDKRLSVYKESAPFVEPVRAAEPAVETAAEPVRAERETTVITAAPRFVEALPTVQPPEEPIAAQPAAAEVNDEQIAENNYYDLHREAAAALANEERIKFEEPAPQKTDNQNYRYYNEIKTELEQLFATFPPEVTLAGIIKDSFWARINYAGDKYYAVGLITADDAPQYICYAVPGEYSAEPPSELKGSCSWLPVRDSDYRGAGYWIMYQNTDTGATITDILL